MKLSELFEFDSLDDLDSWFEDIDKPIRCKCINTSSVLKYDSKTRAEFLWVLINNFTCNECGFRNLISCLKISYTLDLDIITIHEKNLLANFVNILYKIRHDLCIYLFTSYYGSDFSLSNYINSNKTPDYIEVDENNKIFLIYEFSVVNDIQKGYLLKKIDVGGKYNNECQMLSTIGYNVICKYIILNGDLSNLKEYDSLILKPPKEKDDLINLIKNISRFCNIYLSEYSNYAMSRADLKLPTNCGEIQKKLCFGNSYQNQIDNNSIDYKFKGGYKLFREKIYKDSSKLCNYLMSLNLLEKYKIIFDSSKKKIHFVLDDSGITVDELIKNIKTGNIRSLSRFLEYVENSEIGLPDLVIINKEEQIDEFSKIEKKFSFLNWDCQYEHDPGEIKLDQIPSYKIYIRESDIEKCNLISIKDYEKNLIKRLANEIKITTLSNPESDIEVNIPKESFYSSKLDLKTILETQELMNESLRIKNEISGDKIYHPKNSWILPIINPNQEKGDEVSLAKKFLPYINDPLLKIILEGISKKQDIKEIIEKDEKYYVFYKALQDKDQECFNYVRNSKDLESLKKDQSYIQCKRERKKAQQELESWIRLQGISKSSGSKYIKINMSKKSPYYKYWRYEMNHIKTKEAKSINKGLFCQKSEGVYYNFNELLNLMTEIKNNFNKDIWESGSETLNFELGPDNNYFNSLKNEYLTQYKKSYSELKSKSIYHESIAISNLCKSLHFFSTTSLNKNYFMFDKFYNDCLLIVKGGTKIYKNGKSRWFRILFPIDPKLKITYGLGGSNKIININGTLYVCTPWICIYESIIVECMFYDYKITSYLIGLSELNKFNLSLTIDETWFQLMLGFHQKRKTEAMLHNNRYLLMNIYSICSDYKSLLVEQVMECKDIIQSFITLSLINNIVNYYKECKEIDKRLKGFSISLSRQEMDLLHPITNCRIKGLYDYSIGLYLTIMMIKAPVDNLNEQILDFKAVLESYEKYFSEIKSDMLKDSVVDLTKSSWKDIYEKDFTFDPKLCYTIGKFLGGYLRDKGSDLKTKFIEICNDPYETISNAAGLRASDIKSKIFFGKKGYYVVYKESAEVDFEKLKEILNSNESYIERRKKLLELNITLMEKAIDFENKEMMLHMVHKIQRGGPREIYVLDLPTKVRQQILERYFGYLCKILPNEIISVPSNKRTTWIHSRIFEKAGNPGDYKYYHVYDCRRWAPHSNLLKYFYFVSGLGGLLPPEFLDYFFYYWNLYLEKFLVIRGSTYNGVSNNLKFSELLNKIKTIKVEETNCYQLKMPFSFMMGIFNYLSSLLHSANQLYICYLNQKVIDKINNKNSKNNLNLILKSNITLFAHSDDSAGVSYVNSKESLYLTCFNHELLMKGCNHLLSKKKTCVSRVYFEILSILYLGGQFIPLTSKFLPNIVFNPTDGGYSDDIKMAISKCIEIASFGGTFSQSYLMYRLMVHMTAKFYGLKLSPEDYNRPVECFGIPDTHPLLYILVGSTYDDIKLLLKNEKLWELTHCFLSILNEKEWGKKIRPEYTTYNRYINEFPNSLDFEKKIGLKEEEEYFLKFIGQDSSVGLKFDFYKNIKDEKFCWSLDYQTKSRRITRAKWAIKTSCIKTILGYLTYEKFMKLYNNIVGLTLGDSFEGISREKVIFMKEKIEKKEYIQEIKKYGSLYKRSMIGTEDIVAMYKLLDKIIIKKIEHRKIEPTVRPFRINFDIGLTPIKESFDVNKMMIMLYCPKLRPFISITQRDEDNLKKVKEYLPEKILIEKEYTHMILQNLRQKVNKKFYLYSQVPRGFQINNDFRALTQLISYNSFAANELIGLQIPINRRLIFLNAPYINEELIEEESILTDLFSLIDSIYTGTKENIKNLKNILKVTLKMKNESKELTQFLTEILNRQYNSIMTRQLAQSIKMVKDLGKLNVDIEGIEGYYFSIEQLRIGSQWAGKGEITFIHKGKCFSITMMGYNITTIRTSKNIEDLDDFINYIDLCLNSYGFQTLDQLIEICREGPKYIYRNKSGEYSFNREDENLGIQFLEWESDFSFEKLLGYGNVNIEKPGILNIDKGYGKKKKFYLLPKGPYYGMGLKEDMIINNDSNIEIFERFGYKGLTLYELLATKVRKEELMISVDELIQNPAKSRIYEILYYTQNLPLEHNPKLPGDKGSLSRAIIDYKKINEKFPLDLEGIEISSINKMSEYYTGVIVSQLLDFEEKYYNLLTTDEKNKILKEIRQNLSFIKNLKRSSLNEVKKIISSWGLGTFVGALTNIGELSPKLNLEYIVYSVEFMSLEFLNNYTSNFLRIINYSIDYMEKSKKSSYIFLKKYKQTFKNTIYNAILNYVDYKTKYHLNILYLILNLLFTELINSNQEHLINNQCKNSIFPLINSIELNSETRYYFTQSIYKTITIFVDSFIKSGSTKKDINKYLQKIFNFNYRRALLKYPNYSVKNEKVGFLDPSNYYPKKLGNLDINLLNENEKDQFDDFLMEMDYADPEDEVFDERLFEKIQTTELEKTTKLAISIGDKNYDASKLLYPISNKMIHIYEFKYLIYSKNLKFGLIKTKLVNLNAFGINEFAVCSVYEGDPYYKNLLGIISLNFEILKEKLKLEELDAFSGKTYQDLFREILHKEEKREEKEKEEEMTKKEKELKLKLELQKLGLNPDVMTKIEKLLKPTTTIEEILDNILPNFVRGLKEEDIKDIKEKIVEGSTKEELDKFLGVSKTIMGKTPKSLNMIKDEALRAELGTIIPGWQDDFLSNPHYIGKITKKGIINSCKLSLNYMKNNSNKEKIEKVKADVQILLSLVNSCIEKEEGERNVEEQLLSLSNEISDYALREELEKEEIGGPNLQPKGHLLYKTTQLSFKQ